MDIAIKDQDIIQFGEASILRAHVRVSKFQLVSFHSFSTCFRPCPGQYAELSCPAVTFHSLFDCPSYYSQCLQCQLQSSEEAASMSFWHSAYSIDGNRLYCCDPRLGQFLQVGNPMLIEMTVEQYLRAQCTRSQQRVMVSQTANSTMANDRLLP